MGFVIYTFKNYFLRCYLVAIADFQTHIRILLCSARGFEIIFSLSLGCWRMLQMAKPRVVDVSATGNVEDVYVYI